MSVLTGFTLLWMSYLLILWYALMTGDKPRMNRADDLITRLAVKVQVQTLRHMAEQLDANPAVEAPTFLRLIADDLEWSIAPMGAVRRTRDDEGTPRDPHALCGTYGCLFRNPECACHA